MQPGTRPGGLAGAPGVLLAPLAVAYGVVVWLRNLWYDFFARPYRAGFPVVSVGNLSTGGTGKTPFCLYFHERLAVRGLRPALLLRGYRGGAEGSDEAMLYRRRLGESSVFVGVRRRRSMEAARAQGFGSALLDDGFQHRDVARDLDIVLLDGTRPPQRDRLLPTGRLRESLGALRRAHLAVITRVEQADASAVAALVAQLNQRFPRLPVVRAHTAAAGLFDLTGRPFEGVGPYFAVCGLGNPQSFLGFIRHCGIDLAGWRFFSDHHRYAQAEFDAVAAEARRCGASSLLITAKDAVKWKPASQYLPVAVIEIRVELSTEDSRRLEGLLDEALARATRRAG